MFVDNIMYTKKNMIAVTFGPNQISCDYLCQKIQKLINNAHQHDQTKEYILVISVNEITSTDDGLVPKLDHKNI